MIQNLRIKNFVLVEDLEIEFSSKLNILSGETGAGKSVVVGALDLILGQKIKGDLFYRKGEPIYLEASFLINNSKSIPEDNFLSNYIDEENEFVIAREITKESGSKSFINGRRVSLNAIKEVRELLVDFHSQRDQIQLFDNNHQLEIIDTYGGLQHKRELYEQLLNETKSKNKKLNELKEKEIKNEERKRLYEYQINELEEFSLSINEEKELHSELDQRTHKQCLRKYPYYAYTCCCWQHNADNSQGRKHRSTRC